VFGAVLLALTLFVFLPVRHHEFLNFDDPDYVTANAVVRGGLTMKGIAWALTSDAAGNWFPLTWISHMTDVSLFGVDPSAHHLVNVAWHSLSVLLLFSLCVRLTGAVTKSAVVAALFAVHPLHIESVAWIAERKDVLSAACWFLTMHAYVSYARSPDWRRYLATLALFAVGLMSKPMLVTLPVVLLLIDYWPLRRMDGAKRSVRGLILEKLPFFALALASSVVTFVVQQRGGAVQSLDLVPANLRLANAAVTYVEYLVKTLWPVHLAVFYPYPETIPATQVVGALIVLGGVSAAAIRFRARVPYLLTGWLWYLVTLVPVIGIVQVGLQSMADRYTYLPLVGVFVLAVWGIDDLVARRRAGAAALAVAAVAAAVIWSVAQLRTWRDDVSLWTQAVEVTSRNAVAHNNLGQAWSTRGDDRRATAEYVEAIAINPNYPLAHTNLGISRGRQGRVDEAITEFQTALRLRPGDADTHLNLALAYEDRHRLQDALIEALEAVRLAPENPAAHRALASVFDGREQAREAIAEYLEALRLQPNDAAAHNNVAAILAEQHRFDEAIAHYAEAVRLDPRFVDARANLAAALTATGRFKEAIVEYEQLLALDPSRPDLEYEVAVLLNQQGRVTEARAHLTSALRLDPQHERARRLLDSLGR
jgi:tetratricopeptide (TPR) repeat protein